MKRDGPLCLACMEGKKLPVIRMDGGQHRKVKLLIRHLCANYDAGACLVLDDGEPVACPQTLTYSLCCNYFKAAVLPEDGLLYTDLFSDRRKKTCLLCGAPFLPSGNRAVYCPVCAKKEKRKKAVLRKQKQRRRHTLEGAKALR